MREIHKAYELIGKTGLGDIHSAGYILKHRKSGAHITLVENDDDNKVFYIGFRTPPADSTGVAHITEHSVLCGSDKYPVKDPFVELVKGSINTFLNAITYPDKTVYPVASTNDKDFANLMDVYLDAVFNPNIYKHPEIFMQEGWHYELEDTAGDITINGVVYNEMKGAFSSPDDVVSREISNSLFPDTAYGVESGGDPEVIPELTYEAFLDFHKKYYHPSNSFIYLYGDMDMNERLDYLDREYLSKYSAMELDSRIRMQTPFDEPRFVQKPYPIAGGESTENKTYLALNYVVGDALDATLHQAFDIVDYALLSAPGAPLRQALLDEGIGEDIYGGYDSSLLQPIFSVVVKGSEPDKRDRFMEVVERVLRQQVENGLDKKTIEAALNATEFRFREADFGSYPKGLIYGLNMLESWIYDEDQPFLHMQVLSMISDLRKKADEGYFEEIIGRYLISNTHKSVVMVTPEAGLAGKRDAQLAEKLRKYKESLSAEEIENIAAQTLHLKEYQSEPSSPEELLTIPLLKREDLKPDPRPIHYTEFDFDGITALHHNIETSGIHYLELLFDASDCDPHQASVLAFACRLMGLIDTAEYSYFDFSNEMNLYTGGMSVDVSGHVRIDQSYRFFVDVRAKFMYDKTKEAMHLLSQMLLESDYSDLKRIREVLLEEKSHQQRRIMSSGNQMAVLRASANFLKSGVIHDATSGIGYYDFLTDLADNFDEKIEGFLSESRLILERVLTADRLTISSAGDEASFERMRDNLAEGRKLLYPDSGVPEAPDFELLGSNEGLATASAVNYVCRAGNFRKAGHDYNGALHIVRTLLSYDYLWLNVRVKGGAYGCSGSFQRYGISYLTSYRDPNLADTNDVFEKTPEYLENFDCDERDMTKNVIGTISGMDTPLTPAMDASRSLHAYLGDITYEILRKERAEVINATPADIRALAPIVRDVLEQGYITVVGSEDAIKANAELFDEIKQVS